MKQIFLFLVVISTIVAQSQTLEQLNNQRITLPNGWSLTPVGKTLPLGDLPLNIAVSKSGKYMAVTNNGQSTQTIQLFDTKKEIQLDSIVIAKSWYGLKFSADEQKLYASGGNDNWILQYNIINSKLKIADTFRLDTAKRKLVSPSGIEVDDAKQIMYVVTKENNSLYIIDLKTKAIIEIIKLIVWRYFLFTCCVTLPTLIFWAQLINTMCNELDFNANYLLKNVRNLARYCIYKQSRKLFLSFYNFNASVSYSCLFEKGNTIS